MLPPLNRMAHVKYILYTQLNFIYKHFTQLLQNPLHTEEKKREDKNTSEAKKKVRIKPENLIIHSTILPLNTLLFHYIVYII